MTSAICMAVVVVCILFALHFCLNFPVVDSRYRGMNKKCNIYFNYTHRKMDTDKTYTNYSQTYNVCWNEIKASTKGRNLTLDERINCYSKCFQIANGIVKSDGTFDSEYVEKVKQEYKKYSNATTLYMDKIANKLTGCAKKVDETFNSKQKNERANSSPCRVNMLYENCFWEEFGAQAMNATKEKVCGEL